MIMKKTHSKSFFEACLYDDFFRFFIGENPKYSGESIVVLQFQILETNDITVLLELIKKEDFNMVTGTIDIDFPYAVAESNVGSDGNSNGYWFSKQPYPVTTGG